MKRIIYLLLTFLFMAISSCREKPKYTVYWENANLCIVMPRPTLGIVGFNEVDWRGVDLSKVMEDIYDEFILTRRSGTVQLWLRFEIPLTDKYGNETMTYEDYRLVEIPVSEAKKFKSGKYLEAEYRIIEKIKDVAFPFKEGIY